MKANTFIKVLGLGAVGAALCLAHVAHADNPEELAQQAFTKYDAGDYPGAIALYMKAYDISVDARILFNIAQIYDKKVQDRDLAIEFYRRYLKSTTTEPELVAKATERITELGRQESLPKPTPTSTTVAPGSSSAPPTPTPPPPNDAPPKDTAPPESSPPYFVGWIVAGVLGAGAVTTGILSLDASAEVGDSLYTGGAPDDVVALEDRATVLAGMTDGLIAASLVSGTVTLILQLTRATPASTAPAAARFMMVPTASPTGAGVMAIGAF